jgi:Raf kinase inhibitor-like YbhB/YbcL family protein
VLAALVAAFALTSPAFHAGGAIPARYTCTGADASPPLVWTAPPRGTRSFSLTVVDLDAHGFVHWRAAGIPSSARGLRAGQHPPVEGLNTFGRRGWSGPCPPRGAGAHRYVFTLRALGRAGRVLAVARLLGRFGR